jgi:competence protein ComFC
MKFIIILIDLLFPSNCHLCGLPTSIKDNSICHDCVGKIRIINKKIDADDINCSVENYRKIYFSEVISLSDYSDHIKKILYSIKTYNKKEIAVQISPLMTNMVLEYKNKIDIITYVPMHWKKIIKRGFNQSEVIASEISKQMKIRITGTLASVSNTFNQKSLLRDLRFFNTVGKFKVRNKNGFYGKNVLLIDDVFTTGATLNECSRILTEAGAKQVYCATVAYVTEQDRL